jgi:hypothetical protein
MAAVLHFGDYGAMGQRGRALLSPKGFIGPAQHLEELVFWPTHRRMGGLVLMSSPLLCCAANLLQVGPNGRRPGPGGGRCPLRHEPAAGAGPVLCQRRLPARPRRPVGRPAGAALALQRLGGPAAGAAPCLMCAALAVKSCYSDAVCKRVIWRLVWETGHVLRAPSCTPLVSEPARATCINCPRLPNACHD